MKTRCSSLPSGEFDSPVDTSQARPDSTQPLVESEEIEDVPDDCGLTECCDVHVRGLSQLVSTCLLQRFGLYLHNIRFLERRWPRHLLRGGG